MANVEDVLKVDQVLDVWVLRNDGDKVRVIQRFPGLLHLRISRSRQLSRCETAAFPERTYAWQILSLEQARTRPVHAVSNLPICDASSPLGCLRRQQSAGEVEQIYHEPLGTSTISICAILLDKRSLPHIYPRIRPAVGALHLT